MKALRWNSEKNEALKRERGVSFEQVLYYIREGGLLDILEHPNREKFGHQQIFIVEMQEYAYLVPFVEDSEQVFLKTIIPSRKATRHYLKDRKNE